MVTVLELSIFIQKVLWLKLLWFGEFLAVIQEGVQCRNYDCALEGTEAALVSQVITQHRLSPGSQRLNFTLDKMVCSQPGKEFA